MKIVSQKLRNSARGQTCTLRLEGICNFDDSTTILAHLKVNHRGMAIKSPDIFAIHCCSSCHDVLDGRTLGYVDMRDVLRALAETQMRWLDSGLLIVGGEREKPFKPLPKILPRNTSL